MMKARLHVHGKRPRVLLGTLSAVALLLGVAWTSGIPAAASVASSSRYHPAARGELDCNGFSRAQKPLAVLNCTDIRGSTKKTAFTWNGRFYDNGHYIGHDEPDIAFTSSAPGSGNNVSWTYTLARDPAAAPTVATPGHDVAHTFELTPATWFSMALCNPDSFPLTNCTPKSDSNAPICNNANCNFGSGGGSSFMEMQFYPPGEPPTFLGGISCDDTHYCAALNIDSLECIPGFASNFVASCNANCVEPVNLAFIQRNGVPTGPPSPQDQTMASVTPNGETLLMNPGDTVKVHMLDAPAPGGGDAFEVVINDLTTHQSGFMQASAANGFMTSSEADCSGTPFNFQPEYNTAKIGNINPWGADQVNISAAVETGHWEACTSLSGPIANPVDPNDGSQVFSQCNGPYENATTADGNTPETSDAFCFLAGSTHPGFNGPGTSTAPDTLTGCGANFVQNGDLDFDGTPYWPEWPTSLRPTIFPGSFLYSFPTTNGAQYTQFHFQTDVALSEEVTCGPQTGGTGTLAGCTVPPQGPGGFYPYWSQFQSGGSCTLQFGNVSAGSTFGKDAQFGTNGFNTFGYPLFISSSHNNPCL
jgi:hypothetical protein